jgi:hypothetical protein
MLELKRITVVTLLLLGGLCIPAAESQVPGVRGAWKVESYTLKSGVTHHVEGMMMFSDSDWTVVYFVKTDDGEPRRGVGAGGPYLLVDDQLTLTRDYVVIGGKAIGELEEIPLRFTVPGANASTVEECRIEHDGERLTIVFPSGNRMGFRRSSLP